MTKVTDATCALMLGGPVADDLVAAFLWMVGITAVFAPLAIRAIAVASDVRNLEMRADVRKPAVAIAVAPRSPDILTP